MDTINLSSLVQIFAAWGPVGLVALIWWLDQRNMWAIIEKHRTETTEILESYHKDMAETRAMYKSNIRLVESYESIAQDLHELIVLNVQKLTTMENSINRNQFCPMLRVVKDKVEVEKG